MKTFLACATVIAGLIAAPWVALTSPAGAAQTLPRCTAEKPDNCFACARDGRSYILIQGVKVWLPTRCACATEERGAERGAADTVSLPPPTTTDEKPHDDNGHGNDPGKVDPSNPGKSKEH